MKPDRPTLLVISLIVALGLLPLILWTAYAEAQMVPITGTTTLPSRVSTPAEQLVVFAGGFLLKPIYMLLSLGLLVVLWRQRPRHLRSLALSMLFFFAVQIICCINFPILRAESPLLEYGHSAGMVAALGFLVYA